MISATSLNAPNPLSKGPQLPLNLENGRMRNDSQKFLVPSLPVSARPVGLHHASSSEFNKQRRERSIINGTAHPQPPVDHPSYGNSHHHHHPPLSHTYPSQHLVHNGMRSSYSPHGGGSGNPMISPHSNHTSNSSPSSSNHHINSRSSPHHPYSHPHLNTSPRKDAHSPMYIGEVPGLSPGASYSPRSSMPIPCSSPAAASSASPKGSHSHSPSNNTGGNYSPKLPTGPSMLPPSAGGAANLSSMTAATRLYPGFPPPHPSVAAHLSPAFYASVAAAAASHSLPYPMFGSHFNPHSHSAAAASAYLDSFHSALVNRGFDGGNVSSERQTSRSRSPSPPPSRPHGTYHHPHSQQQQQPHSHNHNHHANSSHHQQQSTSVTSLHSKLIESTSVLGDRQSYNGHHNHVHSSPREREQRTSNEGGERYSPGALGLSEGGPLGISGGIMGIGSTRLPNGGSPQKGPHHHPENLIVSKPMVMNNITNGYCVSSKPWIETVANNNMNILSNGKSEHHLSRKMAIDMSSKEGRRDISPRHLHPQHTITNHRISEMHMHPHPHQLSKAAKSITFTSDNHHHPGTNSNNKPTHHAYHINPIVYSHMNGNQHPQQLSNSGILTDSNNAKKHHQQILSQSSNPSSRAMLQQHSHRPNGHPNVNHPPQQSHFLPPSPKKRSPPWNFAVPACPTVKSELPPPPMTIGNHNSAVQNLNASVHEPSKYLNLAPNQNHKPSNSNHHLMPVPTSGNANANHNNTYLPSGQSAQRLSPYPASPRSGPSTPKSPAVHQVKFCFNNASTNSSSSANSKENVNGNKNSSKCSRNDSSSSTSSNESPAPWPVEQMPIIDAFRRGSLIQLASGAFKPVEELRAEDFIHAAANLSDSFRIIHCTVVSIKNDGAKGSTTRVTMAIGSTPHSHQVVVSSSPEQPFFVLGRGWSSLSPKTTERALQLSCGPLSVGDVCITLTKNTSKSTSNQETKAQAGKNGTIVAKGRGTAKSRIAAVQTNSTKRSPTILKNASKPGQGIINPLKQMVKAQVGQKRDGTALLPASAKLTKPIAAASTVFLKPADVLFSGDNDSGPPSPKRRRWSAPEPETQLCPELAESKIKKESKSATPPPSPAVPNKADLLAKSGSPSTKIITSSSATTATATNTSSFSPKMSTDSTTNEQPSSSSPTSKKVIGDINSNVESHHTTPEPPIA